MQTERLALTVVLGVGLMGCPIDETIPDAGSGPPSDPELLQARPYMVVAPPGADAGLKLPVVLALHGYGGNGPSLVARFGLKDMVQSQNVWLVAPTARPNTAGTASWHPSPDHAPGYDVEYLSAILRHMVDAGVADEHRLYVFGYSQGAEMAHRLGCDASDVVVAFASLAGQVVLTPSACAPKHPVSALEIHGTEDEALPYDGTIDDVGNATPGARATISVWGRNEHCKLPLADAGVLYDLSQTIDGPETTVEAYGDCPPGVDVQLWTMNGVFHWPEPTDEFIPDVMTFLLAHSRP